MSHRWFFRDVENRGDPLPRLTTEETTLKTSPTGIRLRAAVLAALCIPLGLAAKSPHVLPDPLVGDTIGGALYVVLLATLVWCAAPRTVIRPWCVAFAVTLTTCALELVQLWQPPFLTSIRATLPGRLVLGSTFDRTDFIGYAIGGLLAALLPRILRIAPLPRIESERNPPCAGSSPSPPPSSPSGRS